jgi:succinate dehydrogenase hydrophobic anchor subunit
MSNFLFVQKRNSGFFLGCYKQEKTKKRKEERRKFFLLVFSSCDLVFFSYWHFFPLANPFASPHVFLHARWFILTLFMFATIHAP